jgi:peptidoglycan/LPS O-acetylase OafA/YrhL
MTLLERFLAVSFKGPGFDRIRLAAAMIVVAHHCWWGTNDLVYRYSGGFVHFGLLAVIVFFCISGFLVTPGLVRSRSVIKFAAHRTLRILPALAIVVIVSMVVLGPMLTDYRMTEYFSDPQLYLYSKNITTLTSNFLPGVIRDGHPVVINGALWTLNIEVSSYIVLAILSIIGALKNRTFFLVPLLISYAIYILPTIDPTFADVIPARFDTFISLFVYFAAGAGLFLYADRIPFSALLALGAVAVALVGLPLGLGPIVLPICVPYVMVYLGVSNFLGRRLFKHDLSYGVYVFHSPILVLVTTLFGIPFGWVSWSLTTCAALMLAYLSWNFVESRALAQKKIVSEWLNVTLDFLVAVMRSQISISWFRYGAGKRWLSGRSRQL